MSSQYPNRTGYEQLFNNWNENIPEPSVTSNPNITSNSNTVSNSYTVSNPYTTSNPVSNSNTTCTIDIHPESMQEEGHPASQKQVSPKQVSLKQQHNTIKINCRTLTGQIMQVTVPTLDNWTILQLKERINEIHNIPVNFQRLIFGGRELQDNQLASACNIENESTIHLLLRQNSLVGRPEVLAMLDANGQLINQRLPVPVDQNGIPLNIPALNAPAPLTIEQQSRLTQLFQYSRLIKMFSLTELIFLIILSMPLPIFAIGIVFVIAGFYGATRYVRSYVSCYLVCIALSIGIRIWLFQDNQTVFSGILMVIGITMELYIGKIVMKFLKLLKNITPTERAELVSMQQ